MSHEEIQSYFISVKKRWKEQAEAERLKEEELDQRTAGQASSKTLLRYSESLKLNRKGHTACFKSITRMKRDHLVDGKNGMLDKTPHAAYYKPKYDVLRKEPQYYSLGGKDIEQYNFTEILDRKDGVHKKKMGDQVVCEKLTRALRRAVQLDRQ